MADETTEAPAEEPKPKKTRKKAAKEPEFPARRASFHPSESLHRRRQMAG
jgi:hypothetical protein